MAADSRWQAPRRPWEVDNAEERKLVRMAIAINEGKVKYDYANDRLKRLMRVSRNSNFFTNSEQEIDQNPDSIIKEACMRGVVGMVNDISEPIVALRLPSEVDTVGFGRAIAKIRNATRNISTHFIREPSDVKPFYIAAVDTLTEDYLHVFEKLYPSVCKTLEAKIANEANKTYEQVLGELKTRSMEFKKEKGEDEIVDFVTLVSSRTTPGIVKGVVRPARKLGKRWKPFVVF